MTDADNPFLSVVIPVYRSEAIVATTVKRVLDVFEADTIDGEILLINDGSPDNSWEVIKNLARAHYRVTAVNLIKNFGQHNAVLCGFAESRGEFIITMDDDLQNPPEEIPTLLKKIREDNFDLVFGKFREKKHAGYRKVGSRIIGYLNKKVFNKPDEITLSNFRIIHRSVIERVLQHKTSYPYIPGLLLLYATKMANVAVEHHARAIGQSNYTLRKILSLVSRLLINYSSFPLRLLSSIGIGISIVSFLMGLVYMFLGLVGIIQEPGWATLVVLISFFGGFIISILGLIGEYLSRILDQLSSNKSYYIKEIVR